MPVNVNIMILLERHKQQNVKYVMKNVQHKINNSKTQLCDGKCIKCKILFLLQVTRVGLSLWHFSIES